MSAEERQADDQDHRSFANAAWSVPAYLMSGMIIYGGLGWLIGRWLGVSALFPIGLLLGVVFALYLVYVRYGR